MSDFNNIIYEVENGRARITLNRPEKLNALSFDLLYELHEAMWEADDNQDVHCVILRGAGRAFSAGYDLGGTPATYSTSRVKSATSDGNYRGGRMVDDDAWQMERTQRFRMAIFDMHKPVIAQVHGACIAGALMLVWACDLIVASDDAFFADPVVRMGIPGVEYFAHPYVMPPRWAKEFLYLGERWTAERALAAGMINRVVAREELADVAMDMARKIAEMPRMGLALTKKAIHEASSNSLDAQLDAERKYQREAGMSDDYKEGVAAFLQKRPADFRAARKT